MMAIMNYEGDVSDCVTETKATDYEILMKKFFTSSASAIFFSNNSTLTDSLNILNPIFFPVEIHIQLPKLVQIVTLEIITFRDSKRG